MFLFDCSPRFALDAYTWSVVIPSSTWKKHVPNKFSVRVLYLPKYDPSDFNFQLTFYLCLTEIRHLGFHNAALEFHMQRHVRFIQFSNSGTSCTRTQFVPEQLGAGNVENVIFAG